MENLSKDGLVNNTFYSAVLGILIQIPPPTVKRKIEIIIRWQEYRKTRGIFTMKLKKGTDEARRESLLMSAEGAKPENYWRRLNLSGKQHRRWTCPWRGIYAGINTPKG
jgi:hypothetical protein